MEKVIIFGASVGGKKTYKMLHSIGLNCEYFVDNSEKKWGSYFEGIEIKPPVILRTNLADIVIASVYYEEIELQLRKMGISPDRIKTRESYVKNFLDQRMEKYSDLFGTVKRGKQKEIIIDLDHGIQVGGIESWAYTVVKGCIKEGIPAMIYTDMEEKEIPFHLEEYTKHFNVSKENFEREILSIAKDMQGYLPFVFIANWMEQSFWAAYILKNIYPQDVSILGMVHHDMRCYYKRNQYIQNCVDSFLCVSSDTRKKMIEKYEISEKKVYYKAVPIDVVNISKEENEKFTIGIGARLDKAKKRVDLIIPLINELEALGTEYQMVIAGDGSFYKTLKAFIDDSDLSSKVYLLGELPVEKMREFWMGVDVVVSTSDSEGMGLSILEGMGAGAVPVVTNTAGITEFVNEANGYVVEINDIKTMASHLKELSENREKVIRMGKNARKTIDDKCSLKGYIDYISKKSVE